MATAEPNQAELLWVAELLGELHAEGIALDASAVSGYFDRSLAEWITAMPEVRADANIHINRVGAAVGELLVRSAGLRWVVYSDEHGAELAVHGQPGDILLFPMNAVAKRWTGEADGTIAQFLALAVASIERAREGR
jgi:hypothetical protein